MTALIRLRNKFNNEVIASESNNEVIASESDKEVIASESNLVCIEFRAHVRLSSKQVPCSETNCKRKYQGNFFFFVSDS